MGWRPSRPGSPAAVGAVIGAVIAAGLLPIGSLAAPAIPEPVSTVDPVRTNEPVILTGQQFPDWSAGPEVTFRAPNPGGTALGSDPQCRAGGDHNCYQSNQLPVRTVPGRNGIDPASLRGYRWNGRAFVQVPFQVDTKWTHYLSNDASGFAFYSGTDQELIYTFDREGFRFTTNPPFDPANPAIVCQARPVGGVVAARDPNPGLIDSDEMVFMARDAGAQAPAGAALPRGITAAREVRVTDPLTGRAAFAYVMESAPAAGGGYSVPPAFTAANSPYVRYARDPNADLMVFSQSAYSNYGNAPKGPACNPDGTPALGQGFKRDPAGNIVLDPATYVQRRPLDGASVTTPRYRFRYDGRWLMDGLQVSPDDRGLSRGDYGPNIVDRWKARAFQQTPGGNTPCCGYEEEQNNWGGSSILMGEKAGPVRVIRATWGADSSTNNVRLEYFYGSEIRYEDHLRVHVIPPLDGIYVQRDMAAGRITRYYNPYQPQGVPVAGINEEVYGNLRTHIGPDGIYADSADRLGDTLRRLNGGRPVTVANPNDQTCNSRACIHGNFDIADLTFSGPPGTLQWEQMSGPYGSVVERWNVSRVTPVGTPAAAVAAVPYYRDDACFDDGTGRDPGPHLAARSPNEPTTWGYDPVTGVAASPAPAGAKQVFARRCWNHHPDGSPYNIRGTASFDPSKPVEASEPAPNPSFSPQGDVRYFQGDVGTHGLHVLFIVDSDNAFMTVPVDEIDTEQRQVVLRGDQPNVGEQFGHSFDKPLVTVVTPR